MKKNYSPSLKDLPQLEAVEQEETGPKGKNAIRKTKMKALARWLTNQNHAT